MTFSKEFVTGVGVPAAVLEALVLAGGDCKSSELRSTTGFSTSKQPNNRNRYNLCQIVLYYPHLLWHIFKTHIRKITNVFV